MTITKHNCVRGLEIKYVMRIIYQLNMKRVHRARRKMELCFENTDDFKKEENDTEIKTWKKSKGIGLCHITF